MSDIEKLNNYDEPLPDFSAVLEEEQLQSGDPMGYIRGLYTTYIGTQALEIFQNAAAIFNYIDNSVIDGLRVSDVFLAGSLIGLRICELRLGTDFSRSIMNVYFYEEVKLRPLPEVAAPDVAAIIIDLADDILENNHDYDDVLKRWGDRITPDEQQRIFLKRGCSFVLAHLSVIEEDAAERQHMMDDLKNATLAPDSWDVALTELSD
jgi:hypothetical protein